MKRVAINALVMSDRAGGLGVFIQKFLDFVLFYRTDFVPVVYLPRSWGENFDHLKDHPNVRLVDQDVNNPARRILNDPFFWPAELKKENINLFYSPMSYIPLGVNVPSVLTVHDLRVFHDKRYYTFLRYHYLKWIIHRSVQTAKHIIAVSQYTVDDLIRNFNIPREKISKVYEGLDVKEYSVSVNKEQQNQIRNRYGIDGPFFLSVGHLEPRKNYIRLIEAFNIFHKQAGSAFKLVITGKENWYYEKIYTKVRELALENDVIFTNFVKESDLPVLYQMADIYITISTFEGFGFTPLESMAAGTPVLCSNSTSLPEIAGDAALYCDPYSVDDIADKLKILSFDKALQENFVKKGFENIERFNWNNCMKSVCNIISSNLYEN